MLRPQDIMVLLKLLADGEPDGWQQQDLARALGLSAAEVHKALKRAAHAGFLQPDRKRVNRNALLEFLVHGLKYVFPAHLGGPTRGLPTAWAAPPLDKKLVGGNDKPVWPYAEGSARGPAVEPLYASAPSAAAADPKLYDLLALVDALRLGGARERKLAEAELGKRFQA